MAQHQPGGGSPAAAAFHSAVERDMARMMRDMHAPRPTGDPDRDFLAMMVPHHQGAIDMARELLVHGRDPLVRQLAADIIASQTVEIEAMRARLAILARGPNPEPAGYPSLGGTRGAGSPDR
jgi:uncharacterized protein (DUF305 family)